MRTNLLLIKGGRVSDLGGGGKGGKGAGPPPGGKRPRRLNPYNDLLYHATSRLYYRNRATGIEEIADRMTKLSYRVMRTHSKISPVAASHIVYDCRRRWRAYDWMMMHAQKGDGEHGGFIPVLVDAKNYDHVYYAMEKDDLKCVTMGLVSAFGTHDSMIQNDADGLPMLIGCLEAQGRQAEADDFREFLAEVRAFARRSAEMRKKVLSL